MNAVTTRRNTLARGQADASSWRARSILAAVAVLSALLVTVSPAATLTWDPSGTGTDGSEGGGTVVLP